ncbi:MAG: hypothetical protein KBE42_07970 [Steroidobacteraceae bacterium]|nr:hypothetical protein [Steroidobacteraceae bacterium]
MRNWAGGIREELVAIARALDAAGLVPAILSDDELQRVIGKFRDYGRLDGA